MRVLIGWEKVDVLETLELLEIIKRDSNGNLVEMEVDLLDSELFTGSVLPDELMDEIEDYLETLNRTILGIDEYQIYIPYFDARLCDSSKCIDEGYVAPEEELLRKAFTLFSNIEKSKEENLQKARKCFLQKVSLCFRNLSRYIHIRKDGMKRIALRKSKY